jgi:putative ABC transport system ATP-binding protein
MLEARELSKSYRGPDQCEMWALREVSLAFERGQATVLVGPSGAGKTTLLSILGALERPTAGLVLFRGKDLGVCSSAELARTRRVIGHIFQSFALIPYLSALENVTYPLIPKGIRRRERNRRAAEWLVRLGLGQLLTRQARALSGGEQQRVAAARALADRPEVILADEPTSNLDPDTGQTMIDVLAEARAGGALLILSSHDSRVAGFADRVCELNAGQVRSVRPNAH